MDYIDEYKDILGVRKFVSRGALKTGTVIQFTYDNQQKYALVLNPSWEGKLHALSLKNLSPDGLRNLLTELEGILDEKEIYQKYVSSAYTENRPYRTYTINKIGALREVFLKKEEVKRNTPEPKVEVPEPEKIKTYSLYEEKQ